MTDNRFVCLMTFIDSYVKGLKPSPSSRRQTLVHCERCHRDVAAFDKTTWVCGEPDRAVRQPA